MPTHGPITTEPKCPRCGYDQSGEVATWTDASPVRGTCPECGTRFDWADLFSPSRQSLRWFVEHAGTKRSTVARSFPTVLRALAPWVFWSRVRVQVRSDPTRLGLWLLLWTFVVHVLTSVPVAVFLMGYSRADDPTWAGLLIPSERMSLLLFASDAVNGLCWPFYTWMPSSQRYYFTVGGEAESAIPYLSPVWVGLCWMLLLLILPTTRRLAKLRFSHLWRAFCLQCAVVLPGVAVARILAAAYEHFWDEWLLWIAGLLPVLLIIWSTLWWACAIRIGWSIRSWTLLVLGFVVVFLSMPLAIGLVIVLVNLIFGDPGY